MDYTDALVMLWRATDEVKRAGELCPIEPGTLHLNTKNGVDYDLAAADFIVQSEEEWKRATVTWRQKAFNVDGGWSRRGVSNAIKSRDLVRIVMECGHVEIAQTPETSNAIATYTCSCATCRDLGYGLDVADPFKKAGSHAVYSHSSNPVDPYVVVRIDRDRDPSSIPEDRLRYLVHFGGKYEASLLISNDGLCAWLGHDRVIGEGPATLDPVAWLQRFGYEVVTR